MITFLSRIICSLALAQALFFGTTLFAQFLVPTNGPEGGRIDQIFEHPLDHGILISLHDYGVYRLNPDGESWAWITENHGCTKLKFDPEGRLFGTDGYTLWRSNPELTAWTRCAGFPVPGVISGDDDDDFVIDPSGRIIAVKIDHFYNESEGYWDQPQIFWSANLGDYWRSADSTGFVHEEHVLLPTFKLARDETGDIWLATDIYGAREPDWKGYYSYRLYRTNQKLGPWEELPIIAGSSRSAADGFPKIEALHSGDGCVFAATECSVFRYDLTDTAWTELAGSQPGDSLRLLHVAADGTIYADQADGTYYSEDNGTHWTFLNSYRLNKKYDHLFQTSTGAILLGTKYSMYRFDEQAADWQAINGGIHALRIDDLEVTSAGDILASGYRAEVDTTQLGTFRSSDLGQTWEQAFPDKAIVSVIQGNPDLYFATTDNIMYRSDDGGDSWTATNVFGPEFVVETASGTLIAAGVNIWRSTDRGLTWLMSCEGLDASRANTNVFYIGVNNNMVAVHASQTESGSYDLLISLDDGLSWQHCPEQPFPVVDRVFIDELGSLYAWDWIDGFRRSDDNGNSWSDIYNIIEPGPFQDPDICPDIIAATLENVLYAQKYTGKLYISADQGETWTSVCDNSPLLSDIAIHPDGYLFAGTHYCSVWRSAESVLGVSRETNPLPTEFTLYQNYPNPFNSTTTFAFDLSSTGPVTMQVFDITGRLAATPISGNLTAGHHSLLWDADALASGIYFYRLKTGQKQQTKKLTLIK